MIRIIGRNKCNKTKKAQRFFKERNIKFQYNDLDERELTAGELNNILKILPAENLLDTDSREYKKRGMTFMEFDCAQELFEDQLLLKTPIIISGKKASAGYDENFCSQIASQEK
ncbi:MAG: ArsC family transcriptional regulator [Spirochaetia bacterium]|nr:ArsC family transcriptional regulator [Spirochaetia bacterium]